MEKNTITIKTLNLIYFIIILFFGIIFWKERALFADCSPALYVFIDSHIPYFGLNRYSTFINYILPCFLSLFNLPINIIVFSFALNYLLVPILVFVFLRYKQTTIKYEVLFLISFAFFNTYTFYYSLHDYWIGFYLFFILIRIVDDNVFEHIKYRVWWILILNLLILNAHTSMLFPLFSFYVFMYFYYNKENKNMLFYAILTLALYFVLNMLFSMSYDKEIVSDNISSISIDLLSRPMIASFLQTILNINFFYLIAILLIIGVLIFNKKFGLLFLFISISVTSFLLFFIFFGDFQYTIYSEGQLKAVSTIIPIMIVLVLYRFMNKKVIFVFCTCCYIFSTIALYKGSFVVSKQYNNIKAMLQKFDSNVYLNSNKDLCPLECISLSRQSLFINRLEFDKNYCIFSNIGNNNFVNILNKSWIDENKKQTNPLLKFPDEIKYIDADSAGIDLSTMFAIYPNHNCNTMIKRLE